MRAAVLWLLYKRLGLEAVFFFALAVHLAGTANCFCLFTGALFAWFFEVLTKLHLAEKAFALHFLFQNPQGLVDIVIAYAYTNQSVSLHSKVLKVDHKPFRVKE